MTPPQAAQLGALRGYIDRVRSSSIAGWAQNADAPEAPVCLDIFADGKLIGRVLANIYRDDLKAAGLGTGRHAFNFMPPAGLVFAPGCDRSAPLARRCALATVRPSERNYRIERRLNRSCQEADASSRQHERLRLTRPGLECGLRVV